MNENIITLFGTISQYWYGKNYIKYFLDKYAGKPVRLQICSYGGEVGEALAISALLNNHGDVTVEYIGLNASAATFLSFGAKRIEMRDDAMWLCHKSMLAIDIYGHLNADKIEEKIKELESAKQNTEAIDLMIAKKYADRSGKKIVEVLNLMKQAKWMPADEVLEWGFVDAVIPSNDKRTAVSIDIKNCLEAVGLPVPADVELPKDSNDEQTMTNNQSLVAQIVAGVKNLFSNKKEDINQNQTVMNEEYNFINTILNVQGVEVSDGKVSLSVEQVKAINEAIKLANEEKQTAEEALLQAENSMNELVNDLDELGEGIKNVEGHKQKVAAIKLILDKLPGQSTEVHNENDEQSKYASVALDPINNYGVE